MSNGQNARLWFVEHNGAISGFGTYAKQSELNPTIVVRELIQNSLDASELAKRDKAIIRFEVESCKQSDIPDFKTYKEAFELAKNSRTPLPDSEQRIVSAMENQIKSDKIEILSVMDNGIGLNEKRMSALLGDGITEGDNTRSGSYGHGHTTVIPTSNLRYILYGGFDNNKAIASGHAVLASFVQGKKIKSNKGFFISNIIDGDMENHYKFPSNEEIPHLIQHKLNTIKAEWKCNSGTAVIIPGFNYFREGADKLWDSITKAAVCNFFVAIAQGKLQIEFKLGKNIQVIDEKNLEAELEKFQDEKRSKGFLPGQKANVAYRTWRDGEDQLIKTDKGDIKIKLRTLVSGGRSQIDICRNGMYITNTTSLTYLKNGYFSNYRPFHCLVLVDKENEAIHQLVRNFETPEHNEILLKSSGEKEDKDLSDLKNVFKQIRNHLHTVLVELNNDDFQIHGVLDIVIPDIDKALQKMSPRVRVGGGESGDDNTDKTNGGNKKPNGLSGTGNFKKSGNTVPFFATAIQTGNRSYEMQVIVEETKNENEIRFYLDEGIDDTCDGANVEDCVILTNIKIDGKEPNEHVLKKDDDGNVLGISLGKAQNGADMKIAFDFKPQDDSIKENSLVSLKAELVSRKEEKEK